MRIAFCGASGTGKSTLANYIAKLFRLETNPIGSRSVAAQMGFSSPYDVDTAGLRGLFQEKLLTSKIEWERGQRHFVTDRATFDNMVYSEMHGGTALSDDYILRAYVHAAIRYDRIYFCSVNVFQNVENDPSRKDDRAYHAEYERRLLEHLKRLETLRDPSRAEVIPILSDSVEDRQKQVVNDIACWER